MLTTSLRWPATADSAGGHFRGVSLYSENQRCEHFGNRAKSLTLGGFHISEVFS